MNPKTSLFKLTAACGLSLALAACGSSGAKVKSHNFTYNTAGLVQNKSAEPTLLYTRTNAPKLSTYDKFIVDPIRVNYSDPDTQTLERDKIERLQAYFYNKMTSELRDKGYSVVTSATPGTMRISFVLASIKAPSASANVVSVLAPFALSVGEVTVEAAFTEAATNRVDAVVVARSKGSSVMNDSPWSTWSDVESALDQWVDGIVQTIDE